MSATSKRRVCSFDMAEVSPEGYVLAEEQVEMYFCNARCLCLWAVHFVTNPRRSAEQKRIACELTMPSGERRKFADFIGQLLPPISTVGELHQQTNDHLRGPHICRRRYTHLVR